VVNARVRGGPPGPVSILRSTAAIHLRFSTDPESGNWRKDYSTQLVHASFSSDSGTIVEMPGTR